MAARKALILLIFTSFFGAAICAEDLYRIGVLGNTESAMTMPVFNTAELACEQASNTVNGYRFEAVLFNENERNVRDSIRNTGSLIALIGCFTPSKRDIIKDLNDAALISICPEDPEFPGRENTLRICAGNAQLGEALARVTAGVFEKNKYSIVYTEGNPEYLAMAEAFRETVASNRRVTDHYKAVEPDRKDFTNVLLYIRDKKSSAIFFAGPWEQAAKLAEQASKMNTGAVVISTDDIHRKAYIKKAGVAAEGGEFTTEMPPSVWKIKGMKSFLADYSKRYDEYHGRMVYSYEAVNAIASAVASGAGGGKEAVAKLKENGFSGVFGKARFDKNGERVEPPFYIYIIRRGEFWQYSLKREARLKYNKTKPR